MCTHCHPISKASSVLIRVEFCCYTVFAKEVMKTMQPHVLESASNSAVRYCSWTGWWVRHVKIDLRT